MAIVEWDRDGDYGQEVQRRIGNLGVEQVPIAARSPWQNPFVPLHRVACLALVSPIPGDDTDEASVGSVPDGVLRTDIPGQALW